jgi:hypothetical protein
MSAHPVRCRNMTFNASGVWVWVWVCGVCSHSAALMGFALLMCGYAGTLDLFSGIQIAQLVLKHRQPKHLKQRIIAFVGRCVRVRACVRVRVCVCFCLWVRGVWCLSPLQTHCRCAHWSHFLCLRVNVQPGRSDREGADKARCQTEEVEHLGRYYLVWRGGGQLGEARGLYQGGEQG